MIVPAALTEKSLSRNSQKHV